MTKTGWGRPARRMLGGLVVACSAACGTSETAGDAAAQPEQRPFPTALATRLQSEIDTWATQPPHRGVSAAVILPGGEEWVATAGVEGADAPLRPDHLIWIASITKSMTGAVIMQLAQEGALQLDDPVSRWLDLPNVNPDITVRQLLNHTSGIANYTGNPVTNAAVNADTLRVISAAELAGFIGAPVFAPGERTQYTNSAFLLLGMIAEQVTGTPITELWKRRLWEPLGLTEIFLPSFQDAPGPVAQAWTGQDAALEVAPLGRKSLLSLGNSAFGLYSNARTVARWGRALFRGSVLSPEMRTQMIGFVPAAGNIPGESGAGLGIRRYDYLGRDEWGHSGGSPLGSSLLLYDDPSGIVVVVIMNQGPRADHFTLAPRLLELALPCVTGETPC